MDLGLAGRVAIVTGGSRGIGRATALRLAAAGARVVVTYRHDHAAAETVVDLARRRGAEAEAALFDLSEPSTMAAVADAAFDRWGRLDILVSNAVDWAPVPPDLRGPFESVPADYWRPLLRANTEGPLAAAQCVVPFMRRQRWGRIVNVSSIAAVDGMPGFAWYAAAKAALHGLTASLAKELGPFGILINVVMPGGTASERVLENLDARLLARQASALPIRRLPEPEDVAAPIAFLASAANTVITGEVVRVSGGRP